MRGISILLLLTMLQIASLAQKIDYTIPEGYEADISKQDFKKIVDIAVQVIAKRYTIELVKEGEVQLKQGQEMQVLNLHNLIAKCVVEKNKAAWETVIKIHFENLFDSFDEQKKIDPENFGSIIKYLSLRIYPNEFVEQRGGAGNLVTKTDLEGTHTLLMLDLPGAFTTVQKAVFNLWKKDSAEVFKIAQANINKQEIEKVTQSFNIDGSTIEISFIGNEDYAASYVLDLIHNSPELIGEWGSAIAIPNKGLVDICKISKNKPVDFVKFIQRMKPRIEQSFQEHPQPISNQFFWYYKGKFTRIKVLTEANGNINVISPFGLTQLMTEVK